MTKKGGGDTGMTWSDVRKNLVTTIDSLLTHISEFNPSQVDEVFGTIYSICLILNQFYITSLSGNHKNSDPPHYLVDMVQKNKLNVETLILNQIERRERQ